MATTLSNATFQDASGEIRFRGTISTDAASGGFSTDTLTATTSVSTPSVLAVVAADGLNVGGATDKLGFFTDGPDLQQSVTGSLSTVADAPAKAVLTSIIDALAAYGLVIDGTT